jgi:hypothetical protein
VALAYGAAEVWLATGFALDAEDAGTWLTTEDEEDDTAIDSADDEATEEEDDCSTSVAVGFGSSVCTLVVEPD